VRSFVQSHSGCPERCLFYAREEVVTCGNIIPIFQPHVKAYALVITHIFENAPIRAMASIGTGNLWVITCYAFA
jgi:hypothetical protein